MKKLNLFEKFIFFLNSVVATALLLAYILPLIPPKTFAFLSVLSLSVPFLILTNLVFSIYWLIKLKKQLFLSLAIILLGYVCYGSIYKFSSSEKNKGDNEISIMSYNVRLFNLYDWIKKPNIENQIVTLIKNEAPDILSLQEYHPHKNIDLSFYKYKYEKLSGNKTKYGQAIFSKYPIINSGSVDFPKTSNNAIFIDVIKETDTLRIYNIHLESLHINADVESLKNEDSEQLFKHIGNTFKTQQTQTDLFLQHKNKCPYKMLICGDFNNTEFSYVYKSIKGNLNDTFKETGDAFGSTYNFKFFPVRIDFILADESMVVNNFKTYEYHYSDHYPIMSKINLE